MPRPAAASNHRVPEHARAETARTLAATPGVRGEPSDAERGRTLLATARTGALATVSVDPAGFPFGSLVAYAVDDLGRPLLCLSDLAEHSRNLAADPRASLMASETGSHSLAPGGGHSLAPGGGHSLAPGGGHSLAPGGGNSLAPGGGHSLAPGGGNSLAPGGGADPLSLARVTLLGSVTELRDDARAAALRTYCERHPDAFYATFDDFRLYRLDVASVRYVGGFGRMSWVSADEHTAAEPDPLRPHVAGIVEHMNDDHADALVAYCRVFGGRPATARAEMVGVDRYGFTMLATDEGAAEPTAVRIAWGRQVDTVGAVRAATIALLQQARGQKPSLRS